MQSKNALHNTRLLSLPSTYLVKYVLIVLIWYICQRNLSIKEFLTANIKEGKIWSTYSHTFCEMKTCSSLGNCYLAGNSAADYSSTGARQEHILQWSELKTLAWKARWRLTGAPHLPSIWSTCITCKRAAAAAGENLVVEFSFWDFSKNSSDKK